MYSKEGSWACSRLVLAEGVELSESQSFDIGHGPTEISALSSSKVLRRHLELWPRETLPFGCAGSPLRI
jgi:hypothetical protein